MASAAPPSVSQALLPGQSHRGTASRTDTSDCEKRKYKKNATNETSVGYSLAPRHTPTNGTVPYPVPPPTRSASKHAVKQRHNCDVPIVTSHRRGKHTAYPPPRTETGTPRNRCSHLPAIRPGLRKPRRNRMSEKGTVARLAKQSKEIITVGTARGENGVAVAKGCVPSVTGARAPISSPRFPRAGDVFKTAATMV